MTDFNINDHILRHEAACIAQDLFEEFIENDLADDEQASDHRDDLMDRAHESADGHQWVIYHHKALMMCAHCDVSEGEAFLEDVGMPETPTFNGLASMIAYGQLRFLIERELEARIEQHGLGYFD